MAGIVVALGVAAAIAYGFFRFGESGPGRSASIAAAPPNGGQTRSLAPPSRADAPTDVSKSSKPARREPPAAPSEASIDRWFLEAYLRCWSPPTTLPPDRDYAAKIRVAHESNGALAAAPILVNPPSNPEWRAYAESAVRAVKQCNPLRVPPDFLPRFDEWKKITLYFAPDRG